MRCRPLRWLWGLIPLLGWAAITIIGEREALEADLSARAAEALQGGGLAWAETTFSGRDAILTGKAAEDADPEKAIAVLSSVWGVRVVDNRAGLIETADAYVWGAILRDNRVKLTGFVPNEETRRMIYGVAQATFPGREIQDQSKLARGSPPRDAWLGGVTFALRQLSQLRRGAVDLDRTALSIDGDANDSKAYASLKTALATGLPAGVTLKEDRVRPATVSPFTWSLAWDGRQSTLAGFVPTEQMREAVSGQLRQALPKASIADRTEIALGEPRGFEKIVPGLMAAIAEFETATIDVRDSQITVTGTAATDVVVETIRQRIKGALDGTAFRLVDQIKFREIVPKPVSPFVTAAEIVGEQVVLTGYVPGETQRTQLLDAVRVRFPKLTTADRTQLAAGAPSGWFSCVDAGLAALVKLKSGSTRLTDRNLELNGATDDEDLHAALPAELKAAANRACETEFKVALNVPPEPNLAWRAVRNEAGLTLEGFVPGPGVQAELLRAATTLFPGVAIVDRMTVAAANSRNWPKAADAGLRALSRLRSGEANITEQTLVVVGEAADAARANAVKELLARSMPRGYVGRETISLRSDAMIWAEQEAKRKADEEAKRKAEDDGKRQAQEAERRRAESEAQRKAEEDARRQAAEVARRQAEDEAKRRARDEAAKKRTEPAVPATPEKKAEADRCTVLMGSAARSGKITFSFASAELSSESFSTLDKLVEIAKTCPDARIEIAGHTDTVGASWFNESLSMQRAEAVVDYLVAAGIDRDRLNAVGHGASRPLVPNTSADNRALNRRIEFEAKPK